MRILALTIVALGLNLCSTIARADDHDRIGLLLSGHSLTDEPIGQMVRDIAVSKGRSAGWVRHNLPGSPISMRTVGHRDDPRQPARFPWRGYASGVDIDGKPANLVSELRDPTAFGGKPYTHVVIAERHDSFGPLQWEMTVPLLRHFYELAREGSPQVRGYFYTTWYDIVGPGSTRDDPAGWVKFEREQLKLWECITSRINDSLANENRADRLITLPASGALADLVDRATTGRVSGITAGTVRQTVDRLFSDNVHLTDLGKYYIACVVYAAITGQTPVGAARPADISDQAAQSLQSIAWEYIDAYYRDQPTGPHHSFDARAKIATSFAGVFWTYHRRPENIKGTVAFFTTPSLENPLWTVPGIDESDFWMPRLP